jgi:hypothetical protein
MLEVERNVASGLRDWHNVFAERMRDARFIENVWILPGEVANDDLRLED